MSIILMVNCDGCDVGFSLKFLTVDVEEELKRRGYKKMLDGLLFCPKCLDKHYSVED